MSDSALQNQQASALSGGNASGVPPPPFAADGSTAAPPPTHPRQEIFIEEVSKSVSTLSYRLYWFSPAGEYQRTQSPNIPSLRTAYNNLLRSKLELLEELSTLEQLHPQSAVAPPTVNSEASLLTLLPLVSDTRPSPVYPYQLASVFQDLASFCPQLVKARLENRVSEKFEPTQVGGALAFLGQTAPIRGMPAVSNAIDITRFQGEPYYTQDPMALENQPMFQLLFRRERNGKLSFTSPRDFRNITSGFGVLVVFFGSNSSINGTMEEANYMDDTQDDRHLGYKASRPKRAEGELFNAVVGSWQNIFLKSGENADQCAEFVQLQRVLQESLASLSVHDESKNAFDPQHSSGRKMCLAVQKAILQIDDALFNIFHERIFTKRFFEEHSGLKLSGGVPRLCARFRTNIIYEDRTKTKEGYILWEGKVCRAMLALWEQGVNPWREGRKWKSDEDLRPGRNMGKAVASGGAGGGNPGSQCVSVWIYPSADLAAITELDMPNDYVECPTEAGWFKVKDPVRSQHINTKTWTPILEKLKRVKAGKAVDKF